MLNPEIGGMDKPSGFESESGIENPDQFADVFKQHFKTSVESSGSSLTDVLEHTADSVNEGRLHFGKTNQMADFLKKNGYEVKIDLDNPIHTKVPDDVEPEQRVERLVYKVSIVDKSGGGVQKAFEVVQPMGGIIDDRRERE